MREAGPCNAQLSWRHTACPSTSPSKGSLWMCKGILHPVLRELERSPSGGLMDDEQKAAGLHFVASRAGSSPRRAPCLGTARSPSAVSPSWALLPSLAAPCPLGMVAAPHLIEFPGHHCSPCSCEARSPSRQPHAHPVEGGANSVSPVALAAVKNNPPTRPCEPDTILKTPLPSLGAD